MGKPKRPAHTNPPRENGGKSSLSTRFEYSKGITGAVFAASSIFLVLRLAAIAFFNPGDRVWGLDYARYILSWDVWLALLLPLAACLPPVARALASFFASRFQKRSLIRYYIIGLLFTAVFVLLATRFQVLYSFLGDGSYCHSEVYRVMVDPGMESQLFDKPTAYLTGQLLRLMASHLTITDTRDPFLLLSLMGIVLLIPGLFVAHRKAPRAEFLLHLAMYIGSPAVLFLFGYIELYILQYVFLALFFACAYQTLRREEPFVVPVILLVISMAFGGSSLIFIPSAMFLVVVRTVTHAPRLVRAMTGLIILTILVFLLLLILQWDDMLSPYLLPVVKGFVTRDDGIMTGWFGYSMVSIPHLIDMVNAFLFIGGLIVVIGLVLLAGSSSKALWSRPEVLFGAVAAAAGILLLFGGNASFGLARDWDLVVPPILGIMFFCATVIIALHESKRISLPLLLPVILLTSAGTGYIWIDLNSSPESAQRIEDIVDSDAHLVSPIVTYSGYENVRKYYGHVRSDEDHSRLIKKMIPTGWHAYLLYNEGLTLSLYLKPEERVRKEMDWYFTHLLELCKQHYPENDYRFMTEKTRNEMLASMLMYVAPARPDITMRYARRAHKEIPDWPYFEFVRTCLDTSIPKDQLAARTEGMITLDAEDPILLSRMGDNYMFAADYQKAVRFFERSIEVEPHEYPGIYMTLSKLYSGPLGDLNRAIDVLERCLDNCRLAPQVKEVRQMLERLQAGEPQRTR